MTWYHDDPIGLADAILVSSSGGIDSAKALLDTAAAATARGMLAKVSVVHSDMGRQEWPARDDLDGEKPPVRPGYDQRGSTELARAQAASVGVPFVTCRREQGDMLQQAGEKNTHHRVGRSTCQGTSDHKRGPIWKVYTRVAKEWRAANPHAGRPCRILEVMGLTSHEGQARKKRVATKYQPCDLGGRIRLNTECTNKGKTRRNVATWLPIAAQSKVEVWSGVRAAHAATGFPNPSYVYSTGIPRLSCSICQFSGRQALNKTAQMRPAFFAAYVACEATWDPARPWEKKFTLADIARDIEDGRTVDQVEEAWGDQA